MEFDPTPPLPPPPLLQNFETDAANRVEKQLPLKNLLTKIGQDLSICIKFDTFTLGILFCRARKKSVTELRDREGGEMELDQPSMKQQ